MSFEDLNRMIKAIEVVKQDYTCPFCKEMCKEPVTLSKCFHIICGAHFDGLRQCPACNVDLEGCTLYYDDRLGPCIDSMKKLDEVFERFKDVAKDENTVSTDRRRSKKTLDTKSDHSINKQPKVVDENTLPENKDLKEVSNRRKKETTVEKLKSQTSKKLDFEKTNKENANLSLKSNASSKNKTIEKRNNKGETLLHIACRLGKIDNIMELLNQGANTNTKDNAGWTPLHEVVQNGRLDLVKLLLQHNTLIDVPGQSNETPLHEAVRYNYLDIAEELVKNGADINAKNCKGETPLQLASDEMKKVLFHASENILQTQGVNVTLMSELHTELDYEDIRVYCTSQQRTVHNKLKLLAKAHSNIHIEAKLTSKVTHIVVDTDEDRICQSSTDVLQGIVMSLWIISDRWITESSEDKLESFEKYEVTGVGTTTYNGPKNSRYNKYKQYPGIFDGCHFYLHNFQTKYEISKAIVLTKPVLMKLITGAGGVVLRRVPNPESIPDSEKLVPFHAKKDGKLVNCSHYIIFKDMFEPMYNMQHLKALPIGWLIECIEKYELCEPW